MPRLGVPSSRRHCPPRAAAARQGDARRHRDRPTAGERAMIESFDRHRRRPRACTHKIAIDDSDLINVRFSPLYGLKSEISRGLRSANSGHRKEKAALSNEQRGPERRTLLLMRYSPLGLPCFIDLIAAKT